MSSKPNLKWRPATENDIGWLARFGGQSKYCYEILRAVDSDFLNEPLYCCISYNDRLEWFGICEVQYDANEEPL